MTAEEIKKAFDICCDTKGCTDCPLLELERQNGCGCKHNLFVSVIDLITEQEKEIERLKDDYAKLQEQFAEYQLASDKEILAQVKQAKIDVLNELKKKTHNYYPSIDSYCMSQHVVLVRDIDKLLEEQNGKDKD